MHNVADDLIHKAYSVSPFMVVGGQEVSRTYQAAPCLVSTRKHVSFLVSFSTFPFAAWLFINGQRPVFFLLYA